MFVLAPFSLWSWHNEEHWEWIPSDCIWVVLSYSFLPSFHSNPHSSFLFHPFLFSPVRGYLDVSSSLLSFHFLLFLPFFYHYIFSSHIIISTWVESSLFSSLLFFFPLQILLLFSSSTSFFSFFLESNASIDIQYECRSRIRREIYRTTEISIDGGDWTGLFHIHLYPFFMYWTHSSCWCLSQIDRTSPNEIILL